MLLLLSAAMADPCQMNLLGPALSRVENAYLSGDSKELSRGVRDARRQIACEVSPLLAARFHHANALEHALTNDWSAAELDLRASLAASPLSEESWRRVADSRLRLAWQRAEETPIVWTPAPVASINGTRMAAVPDVPYLTPGRSTAGSGQGATVRWVSLGTAAIATGLYAGSLSSRGRYEKVRGGPESEVLPAYRATNGLFFGSVGAAALSAGLLGLSFAL